MPKIPVANKVASLFPGLKADLRRARSSQTPAQFVKAGLKTSSLYAFLFTMLFFFVLKKAEQPLVLLVPIYSVLFILIFKYSFLTIQSQIKKRQREIDREVAFIGRYLLVKLYSGRPLLNALIETSSGKGIASTYLKEIVNDISTGSTIEDALQSAMVYSPSEKLKKILFHINNALQLGIDVTGPLESVLEEILQQEQLEIKKYSKKLNTLVIFYMLVAIIVPSLGTSMFLVVSSLLSLPVGFTSLIIVLSLIIILQFVFITLFRSIRPMVNL